MSYTNLFLSKIKYKHSVKKGKKYLEKIPTFWTSDRVKKGSICKNGGIEEKNLYIHSQQKAKIDATKVGIVISGKGHCRASHNGLKNSKLSIGLSSDMQ